MLDQSVPEIPTPNQQFAEALRAAVAAARAHRPEPGSIERVRASAADLKELAVAYRDVREELVADIVAADATSPEKDEHRERLVEAAGKAIPRLRVFEILEATDVLSLAQAAVEESGIDKEEDYSIRLQKDVDVVRLWFDDQSFVMPEELDDDDLSQKEREERARTEERRRWINAHNALSGLQNVLREKGLRLEGEGPHKTTIDDLYHRHSAKVVERITP